MIGKENDWQFYISFLQLFGLYSIIIIESFPMQLKVCIGDTNTIDIQSIAEQIMYNESG